MSEISRRIESLIEKTAEACIPWIQDKEESTLFIDPLDKEEISAHYGASHLSVALIIFGKEKGNRKHFEFGEKLLFSVLDRWDQSKTLPGFHNDFNNFALCVLDSYTNDYHEKIVKTVLNTSDSNHDTVNWLPMRWYVNRCRYQWTCDQKYNEVCDKCRKKIEKATYRDGFIDDRLPLGLSFNLQYDVATVAVMQFLRICGEEIDLSKELGALLNAVCPDGDINYLGRGTNQIFAWGLWIYLLSSSNQNEVDRALTFLEDKVPVMLKNHNIMLNDYPGEEKYMWWDYHYCSVYTAHFLFWLVLALKDCNIKGINPKLIVDRSSGVHVLKNDTSFVVIFDGRKEYLAERGPVVAAIWTKKHGVICKGSFGPWKGAFGNKYIEYDSTLRNYTGLIEVITEKNLKKYRLYRLLCSNKRIVSKETVRPIFSKINDESTLKWYNSKKSSAFFNIVLPNNSILDMIKIEIDGKNISLSPKMKIRNQYGWGILCQSSVSCGLTWSFILK